nr:MAG: Minor capsid protein [Bacteriophage sp.]
MRVATVTLDLDGVPRKVDRIKTDEDLGLFLATEAMRGMSPYVPFRNGYLDASAKAEPFAVTYNTSYAGRIYHGTSLTFSRERHALATAEWDMAYAAAHGQELARAATAYLGR